MTNIETRVKNTVSEKLGIDVGSIRKEQFFVDLANNERIAELFKALEYEFQMRIDKEIKTIKDAIDYAQRHSNIRIV